MCSVTVIRFIICRPQSLKKKETGRNKLVSFWCHVFCFPDSFTHPRVKHAFNDPNKEEPAVVTTRYQNSPQNKGRRSTSEKTLLDRSRLGMKFCSDSEGLTALMDGCVGGAWEGSAPRPPPEGLPPTATPGGGGGAGASAAGRKPWNPEQVTGWWWPRSHPALHGCPRSRET